MTPSDAIAVLEALSERFRPYSGYDVGHVAGVKANRDAIALAIEALREQERTKAGCPVPPNG